MYWMTRFMETALKIKIGTFLLYVAHEYHLVYVQGSILVMGTYFFSIKMNPTYIELYEFQDSFY
jgi:hypothetical protein